MKLLTILSLLLALTAPALAFSGNAQPHPRCSINDKSPPTNVRTQPNGVVIGALHNQNAVKVIDQMRAHDGLWDFVAVLVDDEWTWHPAGWVYDPLILCE